MFATMGHPSGLESMVVSAGTVLVEAVQKIWSGCVNFHRMIHHGRPWLTWLTMGELRKRVA